MIVTPSVDDPELFLTWDAEYALNAVNQGVTAVGIKGTSSLQHLAPLPRSTR